MLLQLIREQRPAFLAVASDGARKDLQRRAFFPGYKAKRDEQGAIDPAILIQLRRIYEIVGLLGIPIVRCRGWEADDAIASIVRQNRDAGESFTIVSQDKDLQQLVRKGVRLLDATRGEIINRKEVEARWGLRPGQILDMLSLAGDSVDGIPGIRGIGIKTAVELLQRYENLKGIYENMEDLTLPMQERLIKGKKDLKMSRRLARLNSKLEVPSLEEIRFKGLDLRRAKPMFARLGFRRWSV